MRILITSYDFFPKLGGIEVMSQLLAEQFVDLGHEVTVVTKTKIDKEKEFPFQVVRRPGFLQFLSLASKCDVFFQNNISIALIWPAFLLRKPLVIALRTWIRRNDGSQGWQDHLKQIVLRTAKKCISNSKEVANHLQVNSTVIGNAYRDDIFGLEPGVKRDKDIVYVGRLVHDKGVDLVLHAVAQLKSQGIRTNATIIGYGSEADNLKALAESLGVTDQVTFTGRIDGQPLTRLINAHKIMVVPSRWDEPFGIVALEGIACGCVLVGSQGGGLKDAIGPCGITFPNGSQEHLTAALHELLTDESKLDRYLEPAKAHLEKHTTKYVAQRYLDVILSAVLTRQGNQQRELA